MKKLILFITIFFYGIGSVLAEDLDVKANIESGKYVFAIEVNLISNKENSKIFYYTDGEGRMDHILEFKKGDRILIKENTKLNYYAMGENYSETKIKENIYEFEYPNKLEISYKDSKIKIKNNTGDVVNLGYFKIEGDSLNYEVNKDTFIENSQYFEMNYELKNDETLKLITPDHKEISSFKYIKEVKSEKKEDKKDIKTDDDKKTEENTTSSGTSEEENINNESNTGETKEENIIQETISNINENLNKNQFLNVESGNNDDINKDEQNNDFNINNEIKSSIGEKNNKDFYIFAYIFLIIILGVSSHNLYNLLKSYTKGQKQK